MRKKETAKSLAARREREYASAQEGDGSRPGRLRLAGTRTGRMGFFLLANFGLTETNMALLPIGKAELRGSGRAFLKHDLASQVFWSAKRGTDERRPELDRF